MKTYLVVFVFIILAFLVGVIFEKMKLSKIPQFITVNASEFNTEIEDKDVVILDIRTPEEFNKGRIAGAVNIDYYKSDFRNILNKLDKDKSYKIYCNSGNRTSKTMEIMKELGFTDVTELSGGIQAWMSGSFPTCTNC